MGMLRRFCQQNCKTGLQKNDENITENGQIFEHTDVNILFSLKPLRPWYHL